MVSEAFGSEGDAVGVLSTLSAGGCLAGSGAATGCCCCCCDEIIGASKGGMEQVG